MMRDQECTQHSENEPWGGKKMWEARLNSLTALVDKLFFTLKIILAVGLTICVMMFIVGMATSDGQEVIVGAVLTRFIIQTAITLCSGALIFAITKLLTHHIISQEIYWANMADKKEKNNKILNEGN